MLKGIAKESFIERIVHNLETRQIKKYLLVVHINLAVCHILKT